MQPPELDNFTWQLRYYRLSRGWFQRDLAGRSGVHRTTVKDVEQGQPPSLLTALLLCQGLGVPMPYLLAAPTTAQRAKLPGLMRGLAERHGQIIADARRAARQG